MDSMNMTNMDGMDMGGMGMGGMNDTSDKACRISMLWNWYTVNACFLSETWQIHSKGGFAGLCIGVILLVMLLEFFRHTIRQYDCYLVNLSQKQAALSTKAGDHPNTTGSPVTDTKEEGEQTAQTAAMAATTFRPDVRQQAIRALLYTLQFATAYWIMLLAMYYNGYIIICILIGAFLGSFLFQWERLQYCAITSSDNVGTGCCC
ncbi:Ctr copper transporter [Xylaria nigripes]|nr:Ctr copper transporter [Xylaria nigripes]